MLEAGGGRAKTSQDIPAVREEQSVNLNKPSLTLVLVRIWGKTNSTDSILELRKPKFRVVSENARSSCE